MGKKTSSGPSVASSRIAAWLAFAGASVFLGLLAVLHFLEPEFNPGWRMISEYELGSYGWMMQLAFFCMGLYCLATVIALRPHVTTTFGRFGLVLLAVAGIIGAGAGVFKTDPITAPATAATAFSLLHSFCGLVFIVGFPIAVTLIRRSLALNEAWAPKRRWLLWVTVLVWVGGLGFIASGIVFSQGKNGFGPKVLIGWPNRFMVAIYSAWILMVTWFTMRFVSKN
jgi:hypothetical protein